MDTRASRYAMWRLHAPPSRDADINPNPKKGGYPAPDRVTFLTGANRDFPNWRRQPLLAQSGPSSPSHAHPRNLVADPVELQTALKSWGTSPNLRIPPIPLA